MKFTKCSGTGNDFIVVLNDEIPDSNCIKRICKEDVGGDGIIVLKKNNQLFENLDLWSAQIFNNDGSNGEFSGNGLRCGAYVILKETNEKQIFIEINNQKILVTSLDKDIVQICLKKTNNSFLELTKTMKDYPFKELLKTCDLSLNYLHVGNPHLIINLFTNNGELSTEIEDELNKLREKGILLEKGINISVINKLYGSDEISNYKIQTFERGVGKTKSCGSAALAAFASLTKANTELKAVNFSTLGGTLNLSLQDNEIIMAGNVKKLFNGNYDMSHDEEEQ